MSVKFLQPHFELEDGQNFNEYCLLIADWRYYIKNELAIIEWADACTPNWERRGMVLTFKHLNDVTNFLLRWT